MDNKTREKLRDSTIAYGSYHALDNGIQRFTGQETLYHGTSKENWEKIKKEGLRADRGGIGGAGAAIDNKKYMNNSKGKVHVTKDRIVANTYARVNSLKGAKDFGGFAGAMFSAPYGPGDGKRVKIKMNYDKWDTKFEPDPDSGATASSKGDAARGNVNIGVDEIVGAEGGRFKARAKRALTYFPKYVKQYPKRFGSGLALTTAGLAGAGYLGNKYYHKTQDYLDKKACEDFQQKVKSFIDKNIAFS